MTEKKLQNLGREDALLCIPTKNSQATETRLDNGDLIISCPVAYKPFFIRLRKWMRADAESTFVRKIQLDGLGIEVWDHINGKKNVQTIVREFARRHSLHIREAELSVTRFLKSLGEKGLIGMRLP